MPDIRVGDGHTTPAADYISCQLAWDSLSGSDQGGAVKVLGKGDLGTGFNPTGASVNPWSLETEGVIYDFTTATRSQLAILYRPKIAAKIEIRHIRVSSNNAFEHSILLGVGSENSIYEYLSIDQPSNGDNGVDAVRVDTTEVGSILRYSDISGGVNGIVHRYLRKVDTSNVLLFNNTDGIEGANGNGTVTDVLAFNNGVDFKTSNTSIVTCASEDLTGNFTGYTSAELVDFAGGDYRTKATSPLATLGSGGSFIGVALEQASGITGSVSYSLDMANLSSAVLIGDSISSTADISLDDVSLVGELTLGNNVGIIASPTLDDALILGESTIGQTINTIGIYVVEDTSLIGESTIGQTINTIGIYVVEDTSLIGESTIGNNLSGASDINLEEALLLGGSTLGSSILGTSSILTQDVALDGQVSIGNIISASLSTFIPNTTLGGVGTLGNTIAGVAGVSIEDASLLGITTIGVVITGTGSPALGNITLQGLVSTGAGITSMMDITLDSTTLKGIVDALIVELLANDISLEGIFDSNVFINTLVNSSNYNFNIYLNLEDIVSNMNISANDINLKGTL